MKKTRTNTRFVALIIILALACAIILMYVLRKDEAKNVIPAGRSTPSSNNAFEDLEDKLRKEAVEKYTKKYEMIKVRKKAFLDAHPMDNLDPKFFTNTEMLKASFEKSVFTVCAIEALLNQIPTASLTDLEFFLDRLATGKVSKLAHHPSHDTMARNTQIAKEKIMSLIRPVIKREFNTPTQPYFVPKKETSLAF